MDPVRVLVADDSLVMRRLLEASLTGWGYEPVPAADGRQAWEVLTGDDPPPIAILDWMMPGLSGLEVCRKLRERGSPPYVYVILLTARGMREDIVEGMNAGADDYVVKPFDKHELEVRLRAGRRIIDLQTELMLAQERLREQAMRDPLTGIWNRACILGMLERELERARREGAPLGVLLLDLDHFKQLNDTRGHQFGDQALRLFAQRIQGAVRSYDGFGRYGGEEFLVVAPHCGRTELLSQAERLRRAVQEQPFAVEGVEFSITVSIGASHVDEENRGGQIELIRAADEALYEAKRTGRNRVVYSPVRVAQRVD
ncbi:MAG: diguanylate cyclase [Bryobacteraceae bacterium]|nr:diguanylate cyclase [Bryobacteraceae bacterium]